MKKIIICLLILLIIVLIISVNIFGIQKQKRNARLFNAEFEQYKEKTIYGTDVATIINKVIDYNERNNIEKDEKGLYKENDTSSIKIEIIMITGEKETTIYPMEAIEKVGVTGFISNFNLIKFKCSNIEYHEKTGQVSKMVFEQIEN